MGRMKIYVCVCLLWCTRMVRNGIIKLVRFCVSTPIRVYVHVWFIRENITIYQNTIHCLVLRHTIALTRVLLLPPLILALHTVPTLIPNHLFR